jgi:hypothetical protein
MKALSLTQPWATLVALGAKRIETRSWPTQYRGPLAIHAAKAFPKAARQFTAEPVVCEAVRARYCQRDIDRRASGFPAYPISAVLATCKLVACLPMEAFICLPGVFDEYPELDTPRERAFGDFDVIDSRNGRRRWAWVLEDVKELEMPIPATGALRLWEWTVAESELRYVA